MRSKILSPSATLMLVLLLFLFTSIGAEGSTEDFRIGKNKSSGGNEVTTFTATTAFTTLPRIHRQAACGSSNLNATVEDLRSLQSPNYPKNYPSHSECWWTITAPVGFQILINFTTFELEKCCDFLQVYNEPSQAKATRSFKTISSKDISSASILSESNCLSMKFMSDVNVQRQGFKLTFKATSTVIVCPTLLAPSNGGKLGYVSNNKTFYFGFFCNKYFKLSGSQQRWCESNGNWTGNQVICAAITSCHELPVPENGTKRCTDGNKLNSTCKFTCDDGYELFGSESRTCRRGNVKKPWSGNDTSCQGSPPTPTCKVDQKNICDGFHHCIDQSDEKGCTCPHYKLKCDCYETGCRSPFGCIPQSWRCNGYDSCSDKSDERDCQCSDTRFQCKDGECIDRSKVNDGNIDCISGDDEFICNKTQGHVKCDCIDENHRCSSSDRCIPNSWIGDTIPDCENHSDEPCNATKVWCDECWVKINKCSTTQSKIILLRHLLENETKCHSLTVPLNQAKLREADWICITSSCGKCLDMFQCESGQVIDNEHYCDRIQHCEDGSDEIVKRFGFRCSGKSRKDLCVLPQKNLYDDVAQCADNSDLCFVNGEFRCFSCLNERLIVSAKQVCDGKVDCYDMSDECLCANQSVCNTVLGEVNSRCPISQMRCYTNTDCVNMYEVFCNSSVYCTNGKNQLFCHQDQQSSGSFICRATNAENFKIRVAATRCDGRPECDNMEDECDCEHRPSFCDDPCAAKASVFGYGNRVCDGIVNQVSNFNQSCDQEVEKNCSMRFYCKRDDVVSIDKRSVCDGIIDCDDHSDENSTDCRNKRFYCTKGKAISINQSFVCDGIKDCDNGEDEVGQMCGESDSLFSDQYEMIANPMLRALFWIMGLLALIGNFFTGYNIVKDILSCENNNIVKLANNIFILNLTTSDFVMGVYLVAVVAQGMRYSGYYGSVDKEWRSSKLCSGLGTLVVLSSETSAFIMASMSTFRLITIYKTFLYTSIKTKWIIMAGCLCWIVSFLLAVIPLFSFDSGYFISDVWFPNIIFKTSTTSKSDMLTLAKRVSREASDHMSWFEIKEIVSDAFKYNQIKGEFGYYGGTSVCMPRIYATTNEAAWQYSTFIVTLNFLLFIYMVFAYVLVYKMATTMNKSLSSKKDPNKGMQKRISRLLLTDFCCWIPVCIMGYLSVAGVSLPHNAYLASAGFLLPINSALNPILYSKFIGDLVTRAKNFFLSHFTFSM